MKRMVLLLISLGAAYCNDAVDPCAAGCGPADLALTDISVVWPSASNRIAYSGDTLRVQVRIQNLGEASVQPTILTVRSELGEGSAEVPPIAAKGIHRVDVLLPISILTRLPFQSESRFLNATLGLQDADAANNVLNGVPFAAEPSTFEVISSPEIRIASANPVVIRVRNPGPHPVPSDVLRTCIYEYDFCVLGSRMRTVATLPEVPPHTTRDLSIAVNVTPETFSRISEAAAYRLLAPWTQLYLLVCYGPAPSSPFADTCAGRTTTALPNFEKICRMSPMPIGVVVSGNVSADCGWQEGHLGPDFLQASPFSIRVFQATAGEEYEFQVLTSDQPPSYGIADAQGRPAVDTSNRQSRLQITQSGTYYVIVMGAGAFTARLDRL